MDSMGTDLRKKVSGSSESESAYHTDEAPLEASQEPLTEESLTHALRALFDKHGFTTYRPPASPDDPVAPYRETAEHGHGMREWTEETIRYLKVLKTGLEESIKEYLEKQPGSNRPIYVFVIDKSARPLMWFALGVFESLAQQYPDIEQRLVFVPINIHHENKNGQINYRVFASSLGLNSVAPPELAILVDEIKDTGKTFNSAQRVLRALKPFINIPKPELFMADYAKTKYLPPWYKQMQYLQLEDPFKTQHLSHFIDTFWQDYVRRRFRIEKFEDFLKQYIRDHWGDIVDLDTSGFTEEDWEDIEKKALNYILSGGGIYSYEKMENRFAKPYSFKVLKQMAKDMQQREQQGSYYKINSLMYKLGKVLDSAG